MGKQCSLQLHMSPATQKRVHSNYMFKLTATVRMKDITLSMHILKTYNATQSEIVEHFHNFPATLIFMKFQTALTFITF